MKIMVIGSGISGATVARRLAEFGHNVDVYEKRIYVGGKLTTGEGKRFNRYVLLSEKNHYDFLKRFGANDYDKPRLGIYSTNGKILKLPICKENEEAFVGDKVLYENDIQISKIVAANSDFTFANEMFRKHGSIIYKHCIKGILEKMYGVDPDSLDMFEAKDFEQNMKDFFKGWPYTLIIDNPRKIIACMLMHDNINTFVGHPITKKFIESKALSNYDYILNTTNVCRLINSGRKLRHIKLNAINSNEFSYLFDGLEEDILFDASASGKLLIHMKTGSGMVSFAVGKSTTSGIPFPSEQSEKTFLDVYKKLLNRYNIISFGMYGSYRMVGIGKCIRQAFLLSELINKDERNDIDVDRLQLLGILR